MTTYAWVGRTRNGQIVQGERAAETPDALTSALRREQILVTKVMPAAAKKDSRVRRVPDRNLAIFTRQFSVMIDAGLPLVQCLELLAKEEPNKHLAKAIDEVRADVEAGAALHKISRARCDNLPHVEPAGGGGFKAAAWAAATGRSRGSLAGPGAGCPPAPRPGSRALRRRRGPRPPRARGARRRARPRPSPPARAPPRTAASRGRARPRRGRPRAGRAGPWSRR